MLGKKRRLSEIIDDRFASMSASIDLKLAERDRNHFEMAANMAAKVIKLEDRVDMQAEEIVRLKKYVEHGEKEQDFQRQEIAKLRHSSRNVRAKLMEHSRKIQALASEAVGFVDLFDSQELDD